MSQTAQTIQTKFGKHIHIRTSTHKHKHTHTFRDKNFVYFQKDKKNLSF